MSASRSDRAIPASAGLAALGLTAALSLPRLPPAAESLVPRHCGFWFFQASAALLRRPAGALLFGLFSAAILFAAAALTLWSVFSPTLAACRGLRRRGGGVLAARLGAAAAGALLIFAGTRLACALFIDVIENAWFFPQSADLREPAALWLALFFCMALGLRAAARFWLWMLAPEPDFAAGRAWAAPSAVLLAAWLSFGGFSAWRWDESRPSLADAAGFVQSSATRRRVLVMTGEGGHPTVAIHRVDFGIPGEIDYGQANLAAAEDYARRRSSVWRLAALRYLYGGQTLQMDADALRRVLTLGQGLGDGLAATLLLENLAVAPVTAEHRRLLDDLADQSRWRVGAQAASAFSKAFRHFGDSPKADDWERRAAEGAGAVAPGLLDRPGGPARPGVIEGAIFPWRQARVALYARPAPEEPVSLAPARLVASALLPSSGRFQFSKLSEGDYFLALAFDVPRNSGQVSAAFRGAGWLTLSRRRGRLDLPALRVRLAVKGASEK